MYTLLSIYQVTPHNVKPAKSFISQDVLRHQEGYGFGNSLAKRLGMDISCPYRVKLTKTLKSIESVNSPVSLSLRYHNMSLDPGKYKHNEIHFNTKPKIN